MPADKSQLVRLVDVLLLGPFMIWFGIAKSPGKFPRSLMVTAGITTVLYNLQNYLSNLNTGLNLFGESSDSTYAVLTLFIGVLVYYCI